MSNNQPSLLDKARYNLLKSYAGTEIKPVTTKRRVGFAARYGLIGGAAGIPLRLAVQKFTKGKRKLTPYGIAADVAIGTIMGAFSPDIRNAIVRANIDPSKKPEAMQKLREAIREKQKARRAIMPLPSFQKESAFWGTLARGIGTGAKAVGIGLLPMGKRFSGAAMRIAGRTKPFTLAQRAAGWTIKGGAGYGLYRGGKALYHTVQRERNTGAGTYTTMLRNNLLAGRIRPEELSPEDMSSVRKLGMR